MTNEEIVEEIYHEAYAHGFINELRAKIESFKTCVNNYKLPHHEMVYKAYHIVKPQETNHNSEVFI